MSKDAKPRVRRPGPLEYLPPIEEDERVGEDYTPIEEDVVVKNSDEFEPVSEDVVVGIPSYILIDNGDKTFLLECPSCKATISNQLGFCPGCGIMVPFELRSRS